MTTGTSILTPRANAVAALLAFVLPPAALAQSFTGTYVISNRQGEATTLALRQTAEGQLTGSFSGNGTQLQVEGLVEEGTAMGTITGAEGGVFFEGTLEIQFNQRVYGRSLCQ